MKALFSKILNNLDSSKKTDMTDIYQKLLKHSRFSEKSVQLKFNSPTSKDKIVFFDEKQGSTLPATISRENHKIGTITSSKSIPPILAFPSISEKSKDLESLNSMDLSKIMPRNEKNTINYSDNHIIEEILQESTKLSPDKVSQKITPDRMTLVVDPVPVFIPSPFRKTYFTKKESKSTDFSKGVNSFSTSRNSKHEFNKNLPLSQTNGKKAENNVKMTISRIGEKKPRLKSTKSFSNLTKPIDKVEPTQDLSSFTRNLKTNKLMDFQTNWNCSRQTDGPNKISLRKINKSSNDKRIKLTTSENEMKIKQNYSSVHKK